MAFIWNDESLAILRENAGILTTEQIAQLLHTNITAVRNMAYRLKLSLRVTAYNHRRIAQVQALYASETLSLKEIAAKTGLTASTVQYIVYVKSKNKPYATTEYVSFETENAVKWRAGCAERCTSGSGRRGREIVRLRPASYSTQHMAGGRLCGVHH
ncbi:hypothetical protein R9S09_00895 [Escherichia coli]